MMPVTSQRFSVPRVAPVISLANCLFVDEKPPVTDPDDSSGSRDIEQAFDVETNLLLQSHDLKPLKITKVLSPVLCLLLLCPAALCPLLINLVLLP